MRAPSPRSASPRKPSHGVDRRGFTLARCSFGPSIPKLGFGRADTGIAFGARYGELPVLFRVRWPTASPPALSATAYKRSKRPPRGGPPTITLRCSDSPQDVNAQFVSSPGKVTGKPFCYPGTQTRTRWLPLPTSLPRLHRRGQYRRPHRKQSPTEASPEHKQLTPATSRPCAPTATKSRPTRRRPRAAPGRTRSVRRASNYTPTPASRRLTMNNHEICDELRPTRPRVLVVGQGDPVFARLGPLPDSMGEQDVNRRFRLLNSRVDCAASLFDGPVATRADAPDNTYSGGGVNTGVTSLCRSRQRQRHGLVRRAAVGRVLTALARVTGPEPRDGERPLPVPPGRGPPSRPARPPFGHGVSDSVRVTGFSTARIGGHIGLKGLCW